MLAHVGDGSKCHNVNGIALTNEKDIIANDRRKEWGT
jgi:hypothetical protein